ncbi:hypothetical protein [Endozoicomonas sp. GU-1]|nr:hypothetical protein [Endozoicomonas sp. GU-1]WBA88208.1 hypothetical protein O3276_09530 [Endozoicomonas sp. GU-1]
MEEALQAPTIEKSIKERYVAGVNKGVVPFVSHIPYQESLPAIEGGQNANRQTTGSTESDDDSGYETASKLSDIPDPWDVDDMERVYRFPDEAQDEGYSESPVSHNHADTFNDELQQALADSRVTEVTDQLRRADREAVELAEALSHSLATANDENDPALARALALSRETQQLDEQLRSARERADVAKATQRSLDSGTSKITESDPAMTQGLASSKESDAVRRAKAIRKERKAAAILEKYHRKFVKTVRDGNCFYDGMSKIRRDASITELRQKSYDEGKRCLDGNGKLKFHPALTSLFEKQIDKLMESYNYAQQIDLRLMAYTENCWIIVCDLDEKVVNVAGPEGELEEYPKKTLSEIMGQYPEAELFVFDKEGRHYMTGKKK